MTTKADIEAQIEALKRKLKESEMDADFTPTELVRWDPSLLGTVLHLKYHTEGIKRGTFRNVYKWEGSTYVQQSDFNAEMKRSSSYDIPNDIECAELCHSGVLTTNGVHLYNDEIYTGKFRSVFPVVYPIYNTINTFEGISKIKLITAVHNQDVRSLYGKERPSYIIKQHIIPINEEVKDLQLKDGFITTGCLSIKLTKPDDNLLDKIHIAKVVKLPFQDKEVIIDLYPLSTLYKEWKADKVAKRPIRTGAKWHGIRPDWAGDETLTWRTKPNMQGSRTYHSAPTLAGKKVEEHIPSCDCTMCITMKDHP